MSGADHDGLCRPCSRGQHEMCTLHDKCACDECNPPVVVWEDPPRPQGRGRTSYHPSSAELDAMRANPGRWARLKDYGSSSGAATSAKKLREANPEFEFIGRRVGPKVSALYSRFGAS